ncbi:hypothetical protein ACIBO4_01815 [Streptomyces sp. NPDC050149]|uniref:hypothetical protein n=1 Tax=Streptomyces sp. NPDC050149 TaxID=3365603 RepID=UPI0037ABA5A3
MYNTQYMEVPAPNDVAADELAKAVYGRWQDEAGRRQLVSPAPLPVRWRLSTRVLTGRVTGATAEGPAGFSPLPGLAVATADRLGEGGELSELHAVYGGLASGRLLLVGESTVGKTAAAVLLLLTALKYRECTAPQNRGRVPVPVLLDLDGWDPADESVVEWAVGKLSRQYTLLQGTQGRERARMLLEEGRIALFLDGLDEVSRKARANLVRALDPAPCRLVVISRSYEAGHTAKKARLGRAVALEIRPVLPADAARYLLAGMPEPAPPPWEAVARSLLEKPDGAVTRALSYPLAVSLLHTVYPEDGPVDELLDTARFSNPHQVEEHLLDHAVAAAYTPRYTRNGFSRPRYSPETAERTLRHIAAQLAQEGTQDLRWWHIPSWADTRPRARVVGIVTGLLYGAVGVWGLWPAPGPAWACVLGPIAAVMSGVLAAHRISELGSPKPLASTGWRDIFPSGALLIGLMNWLVSATALQIFFRAGLAEPSMPVWLCCLSTLPIGFSATMSSGLGHQLMAGSWLANGSGHRYDALRRRMVPRLTMDSRSLGPQHVWRHHSRVRLLLGLLCGLANALMAGLLIGWVFTPGDGVRLGLLAGLWPIVNAGLLGNVAVSTTLTAVQLSVREGTPVRMAAFLDDAHRRNLLRAIGPVYQFRHARLQERLARPL